MPTAYESELAVMAASKIGHFLLDATYEHGLVNVVSENPAKLTAREIAEQVQKADDRKRLARGIQSPKSAPCAGHALHCTLAVDGEFAHGVGVTLGTNTYESS